MIRADKCGCDLSHLPDGAFFRSGWHAIRRTESQWRYRLIYDFMVDSGHSNQLYRPERIPGIRVDSTTEEIKLARIKAKKLISETETTNRRIMNEYFLDLTNVKEPATLKRMAKIRPDINQRAAKMDGSLVFLEKCPGFVIEITEGLVNKKKSRAARDGRRVV